MIPVLSRAEMQAFDGHAIRACRVPSLVLMENAGRAVADEVARLLSSGKRRVEVVCGPGNNGGDGFVAARHLVTRGYEVGVHLVGSPESLKGDARANHDALTGLGVSVASGETSGALRAHIASADVLVDALFGTGLDRALAGQHAESVEIINATAKPVVAVDVPSGMNADTGRAMGAAVRAASTVTFGLPKRGLLTPSGADLAGKLVVADLGVPSALAEKVGYGARLSEARDVAALITRRPTSAHKGSSGHVAVFAGSPGKVGAALLSGRGALRAGAGLVTVVTWPDAAPAIEGRVPELMTTRLDPGDLLGSVDEVLAGKRAVVIGPGFGTDDAARAVVEHVLGTWQGPSVVDADALALYAGRPEAFAASSGAPVLTPHPGELGRLLSTSAAEVEADRFGALASAVGQARCVMVLKGAHTLVGAPDERTVVNPTGNPALATAGAGDVLSGVLGALLCVLDPFEAAWAGVYVHALAADLWRASDARGTAASPGRDRGLLAHEVSDLVPDALRAVIHGDCLD